MYTGPSGGMVPPAETRVGVPNGLGVFAFVFVFVFVILLPPFGPLGTGPPVELISRVGDCPPAGRSAPEGVDGEDEEEEGRP